MKISPGIRLTLLLATAATLAPLARAEAPAMVARRPPAIEVQAQGPEGSATVAQIPVEERLTDLVLRLAGRSWSARLGEDAGLLAEAWIWHPKGQPGRPWLATVWAQGARRLEVRVHRVTTDGALKLARSWTSVGDVTATSGAEFLELTGRDARGKVVRTRIPTP